MSVQQRAVNLFLQTCLSRGRAIPDPNAEGILCGDSIIGLQRLPCLCHFSLSFRR